MLVHGYILAHSRVECQLMPMASGGQAVNLLVDDDWGGGSAGDVDGDSGYVRGKNDSGDSEDKQESLAAFGAGNWSGVIEALIHCAFVLFVFCFYKMFAFA